MGPALLCRSRSAMEPVPGADRAPVGLPLPGRDGVAGPGENGHAHALNSFFSLCACQRMMPTATSTMMIVSTVAMAAP